MKQSQKLTIRGSEIRAELAELAANDSLTEEQTKQIETLRKEYKDVEIRIAASITSEDDEHKDDPKDDGNEDDPKDVEFRSLVEKASLQSILNHVIDKKTVDGATLELQKELSLNDDQVPLELLVDSGIETRQAHTPAPATVGLNVQPVIKPIFPMSVTSFLGVSTPTVAAGEPLYPILTTRQYASDVDAGASVDEYAGMFETKSLEPRRIQASFFYRREDKARFSQLETAMRENLRQSLAAGMDDYILNKANLGLLKFGNAPAIVGAKPATWIDFSNLIYSAVDGLYASDTTSLAVLIGIDTLKHAAGLYRTDQSNMSALDYIKGQSSVRSSFYVAAKAAKTQEGLIGRGTNLTNAVAPVWQGVHLIPDEITKAKSGEISLTAVMLMNFEVIRADGYQRFKLQLDA